MSYERVALNVQNHLTRGWQAAPGCPACQHNSHLCIDAMKDLRDALALIRAYREALEQHGQHTENCLADDKGDEWCACGWSAARERLGIR